jgi:hypothetical protein
VFFHSNIHQLHNHNHVLLRAAVLAAKEAAEEVACVEGGFRARLGEHEVFELGQHLIPNEKEHQANTNVNTNSVWAST